MVPKRCLATAFITAVTTFKSHSALVGALRLFVLTESNCEWLDGACDHKIHTGLGFRVWGLLGICIYSSMPLPPSEL